MVNHAGRAERRNRRASYHNGEKLLGSGAQAAAAADSIAPSGGGQNKTARHGQQPRDLLHDGCTLSVEQKAPAWSADGRSIAVLEGTEEVYLSTFTGVPNPTRDALITSSLSTPPVPPRSTCAARRRLSACM